MRRQWSALAVGAVVVGGCGGVHRAAAVAGAHLSCSREVTEADISPPGRIRPHAGDLVVGPLSFPDGLRLADMRPRQFLATGSLGAYKLPPVLAPGVTVTISIASSARHHVVMDIPEGPSAGVVTATYSGCPHAWGFFPQGFRFTDGRIRGCVPLDITVQGQRPRHVVLSLFAGACPA